MPKNKAWERKRYTCKKIDINFETERAHTLITDTTGPLPGPRKKYHQKPPSPFICPNTTTAGADLSKHYKGYKKCSYRGHYFKKPRNKNAVKYCTSYHHTPKDNPGPLKDCNNTSFKIPVKRPYNCQEVESWRQKHHHQETDPQLLTPEDLAAARINHIMKMAFGSRVNIPGEKTRFRREYFDTLEVMEYRAFIENELTRERLEDEELREWIKPTPRVCQNPPTVEGIPGKAPARGVA